MSTNMKCLLFGVLTRKVSCYGCLDSVYYGGFCSRGRCRAFNHCRSPSVYWTLLSPSKSVFFKCQGVWNSGYFISITLFSLRHISYEPRTAVPDKLVAMPASIIVNKSTRDFVLEGCARVC